MPRRAQYHGVFSVADNRVFQFKAMHEVVPVAALEIGMFVAELDRPWLGTPFLLQGFLIESAEQVAQLQAVCQFVGVDRRRSTGVQHAAPERQRVTPLLSGGSAAQRAKSARVADAEFLPIAKRLRQRKRDKDNQHEKDKKGIAALRQRPASGESALEAELLYSAPVIDDVQRTLLAIREAIDASVNPDLSRVGGLVQEMAAGVERNPDALLWLTRLKKTDQYSYDHAIDVSVHVMVFGRFLGLSSLLVEELGLAGLMQDVGKTQLDPEILSKPEALTDAEYQEVQSHVASSLELLVNQPAFSSGVLSIIAAHHERHDGSGYPRRLDGKYLSLPVELAGLIDTYCALTRHRVYSAAVSSQKALEMLVRMRGSLFREALVDQFVQCVGLYPIGTLLELNTGEVAVVIQQNQVRRLKPRLLILLAQDKSIERRPRNLDLMLEPLTPTGMPYRIKNALPPNAYGIDPAEFFLD